MIGFKFFAICSYSIAIAVFIGLIRFRNIHRTYQPFIFITIAALLNEITSSYLISNKIGNAPSNNIFGLIECFLWFWQFKRWEAFKRHPWQLPFLLISIVSIWIIENIVLGKLFTFSSVYSIAYSFLLIFLTINEVNKLIVQEKGNLFKNSRFLICSGTIIFYTYRIMVEPFYLLELSQTQYFMTNIITILVFVNLFVNLLFALAILWIPRRQRFSQLY